MQQANDGRGDAECDSPTCARDPRIAAFAEIVERHGLHGLVFQHLALCVRRAWLHLNRIDYAHLEERMRLGAVAHQVARPRDASVAGLMGLAPDRIDWTRRCVIEAKNKAGAKDAVGLQTAFYALMLSAATGERWLAANDILAEKRNRQVIVDDLMIDRMLALAQQAATLVKQEDTPEAVRKPICDSCSYRFLCGYG